jgi:hypothetical protein
MIKRLLIVVILLLFAITTYGAKTYLLPQAFYYKHLKGGFVAVPSYLNTMTYYIGCWSDKTYQYNVLIITAYTDDKDMKSFMKDWKDIKKLDPAIIEYTVIDGNTSDPNYVKAKVKD